MKLVDSIDNSKGYEALCDMKMELQDEKRYLETMLQTERDSIEENNRYVETILEKENVGFKMFSPREVESLYKERITQKHAEIELREREIRDLEKKLISVNDKSDRLQVVMDEYIELLRANPIHIPHKEEVHDYVGYVDEERKRITNELHDTAVQNLTHLLHRIELCKRYMDQDLTRSKLEMATISNIIKETIAGLRQTIYNLRPPIMDDIGFSAAIDKLIEGLSVSTDILIEYRIDGDEPTNETTYLIEIYRIIQEAITNAIKHSGGTKVLVSFMNREDSYRILVSDNGKGKSDSSSFETLNGFGLMVMKDRARLLGGEVKVISGSYGGMTIDVVLPKERI